MASGPTSVRSCISAEAGADFELAKDAVRSPLCGWLLKRKSNGSRSRFVCGSNRRYVTFDFSAQVFYYAHSETKKSVSVPTPFHDLLGVESLFNTEELTEDHEDPLPPPVQRSISKGSLASAFKMPKIASFGALKRPTAQHGFALRTTTKTTEFFCGSESEASMWIEGIKDAMVLGSGANKQNRNDDDASRVELSTASGSSTRTLPSPRSAEETSGIDVAPPTCENSCTDPTQENPCTDSKQENSCTDPIHENSCVDPIHENACVDPIRENSCVDPIHENSCEESMDTSSKLATSMAVTALDRKEVLSLDRCNDAWGCRANDSGARNTSMPRYADKAEGLSLNQRLQQLEFSDDEDEDEDGNPAMFSTTAPVTAIAAAPTRSSQDNNGAVTIDACQSFRQEDSDDE